MNKTGSISGWSEGILLSLAFVAVFGIIIFNFNSLYTKNYVIPITDNSTESLFINYQGNSQDKIEGGEVEFDASQGITLKSSYGLTKDVIKVVWTFISGGWIEQTAQMWNIGDSGMLLARALRILYFLSLIFALLYMLFKVTI